MEAPMYARRLREVQDALGQILAWIKELSFDAADPEKIRAEIDARQPALRHDNATNKEQIEDPTSQVRALGAGWLEWRMVAKPSGREFGPYVYYRCREAGRKRTKYVGKVG